MKQAENWDLSPSMSEVELHYVSESLEPVQQQITNPKEAVALFRLIWNENTMQLREEFYVILLDNAKHCLGWCKTSMGGRTSTIVDVSQVVTLALLGNAHSVVVAHNHPSGNLNASRADVNLTNKIATALHWHDLQLDDHIILTKEEFYSFRMHDRIKIQPLS